MSSLRPDLPEPPPNGTPGSDGWSPRERLRWREWRRRLRWWHVVLAGVLVLAVALLVRSFVAGREEAEQEQETEEPLATAARITTVDGQVAVVLPRQAQLRAGILVEPLQAASSAGTVLRAYGLVLPLDSLGPQRDAYAAALGRARAAEAQLATSRREYERRRLLYAEDQNVSAAALEQARASMESDQASAAADEVPARTLAATARQQWGPVVGSWIVGGSPEFARLLARRDVLVQVTLPPGDFVRQPPPTISLEPGAGPVVPARYVSTAAQTDPRIQGMSFFYVATATPLLLSGMTVTANLGAGSGPAAGVLVPEAAVVWSQGNPWVYVQTGPTVFVRRRIVTSTPAAGGGYVATDLAAGTPVVVRGAEMLLSEEFRSQIQMTD